MDVYDSVSDDEWTVVHTASVRLMVREKMIV